MLQHDVLVRPTDSPRAIETAAMFGLALRAEHRQTIIPPVDLPLPPACVVFITGPSGSGKSTLLRLIRHQYRDNHEALIDLNDMPDLTARDEAITDVFSNDQTIQQTMHRLAMVGLADAFIMLRRPRELSDGQRMRLRLAQAMAAAESADRRCIIMADEFAATLDRLTARTISCNVRRWITSTQHTFIAATTHDDLVDSLRPRVLVRKGLGDAIDVQRDLTWDTPQRSNDALPDATMRIETGCMADYEQLARFHYRQGLPRAVTGIDAIIRRRACFSGPSAAAKSADREVLGVLVRTMPRLSCSLRDVATDGRYTNMTRALAARLLNREVRTISRVIIDPRCRGMGLATRLVQHALANAQTIYTEALAAMGRVHPFFECAGMQRFDRPPHARDARLHDALHTCGYTASDLTDAASLIAALTHDSRPRSALLRRELRRWAGRDAPMHEIIADAAQRLLGQPVYYIWRSPLRNE